MPQSIHTRFSADLHKFGVILVIMACCDLYGCFRFYVIQYDVVGDPTHINILFRQVVFKKYLYFRKRYIRDVDDMSPLSFHLVKVIHEESGEVRGSLQTNNRNELILSVTGESRMYIQD